MPRSKYASQTAKRISTRAKTAARVGGPKKSTGAAAARAKKAAAIAKPTPQRTYRTQQGKGPGVGTNLIFSGNKVRNEQPGTFVRKKNIHRQQVYGTSASEQKRKTQDIAQTFGQGKKTASGGIQDPRTGKTYKAASAKGQFLMGKAPKGEKMAASDRPFEEAFRMIQGQGPEEFTQRGRNVSGAERKTLAKRRQAGEFQPGITPEEKAARAPAAPEAPAAEKEPGALQQMMAGPIAKAKEMAEGLRPERRGIMDLLQPPISRAQELAEQAKQTGVPQKDITQVEDLTRQAENSGLPQDEAQRLQEEVATGETDPQKAQEFLQQSIQNPEAQEERMVDQELENSGTVTGFDASNLSAPSESLGYQTPVQEKPVSYEQTVADNLGSLTDTSGGSLLNEMQAMMQEDDEFSSARAFIQGTFAEKMGIIENDAKSQYYERLHMQTMEAFGGAEESMQKEVAEIDKMINDPDAVPTSYAGLAAKTYAQAKDMQLESITDEKEYQKKQFDVWHNQEADKRARLEGYLKAKLYASGAQDSSAGLATMALTVNAADMRMQMAEADHNYAMSGLNKQSRSIMKEFTSNVVKLGLDAEASRDKSMAANQEKLMEIEKLIIESEGEKTKLRLDTISDMQDQMSKVDTQEREQKKWEYEQQYKKIKDATDNAYKLSGLTGNVFYANPETGEVVDTGVQTFDAQKWEQTALLDAAKYEHMVNKDTWDMEYKERDMAFKQMESTERLSLDQAKAASEQSNSLWSQGMNLLDTYGSEGAGMVENMLGMPAGSLSTLNTVEEQKAFMENQFDASFFGDGLDSDFFGIDLAGQAIAGGGGDGGSITGVRTAGYYKSKSFPGLGLQCGEFVHEFMNVGSMGNSLASKLKNFKNKDPGYMPKVGDAFITNESAKYGHVGIINAVDPATGMITLTEANFPTSGNVQHDRTMMYNDSRIKGFHTGNLKPQIQSRLDRQVQEREVVDNLIGKEGGKFFNNPLGFMGTKVQNAMGLMLEAKGMSSGNPILQQKVQNAEQKMVDQMTPMEKQSYEMYDAGETNIMENIGLTEKGQAQWWQRYMTYKSTQGQGSTDDVNQVIGQYAAKNPAWSNAIDQMSVRLNSEFKATQFDQRVRENLDAGDLEGAKGIIKAQAKGIMSTKTRNSVQGAEVLLEFLDDIESDLNNYESLGGSTGVFSGKIEKISQKGGLSSDPVKAELEIKIAKRIQRYRNDVSGAAFTESENREYKAMFPSISAGKELNIARINGLRASVDMDVNSYYRFEIGSSYDELFGEGSYFPEATTQATQGYVSNQSVSSSQALSLFN